MALPFLAVFGGAAAMELKNRITGDYDVKELRKREHELKKMVEDIQSEMKGDREQVEALRQEKERLEAERSKLAEEAARLAAEKDVLAESEAALREQQAELQEANRLLSQQKEELAGQMSQLRLKSQQDEALLQRLRERVGRAMDQFACGELSSEELLGELAGLGVRVVRPDGAELPQLVAPNGGQPMGLQLDESWKHQLQLVFDRPDGAVKLLNTARGHYTASGGGSSSSNPLPLPGTPRRGFPALKATTEGAPASATPRLLGRLSSLAPHHQQQQPAEAMSAALGGKENSLPSLAAGASSASPASPQAVMMLTQASPPNARGKQQAMVVSEQQQPAKALRGKSAAGGMPVPKLSLGGAALDAPAQQQAQQSRGVLSMLSSASTSLSPEPSVAPPSSSSKQLVRM